MQKKIQMRKLIIFVLGIFIAFLVVSLISGDKELEEIVIVKEKIDLTTTLDQQIERLEVIKISKNESQRLGDSVLRNLGMDISGKRLIYDLEIGSPIPKTLLSEGDTFGEFASSTPKNRTIYRIAGGVSKLPPGVSPGDRIDIGLLAEDKITVLYRGLKISQITESDIFLDVGQRDHYRLILAERSGEFILQLPGKKEVPLCRELSDEEKEVMECYNETDTARMVDISEIEERISLGLPFDDLEDEEESFEDNFSNGGGSVGEGNFKDLLRFYQNGDSGFEVPIENEGYEVFKSRSVISNDIRENDFVEVMIEKEGQINTLYKKLEVLEVTDFSVILKVSTKDFDRLLSAEEYGKLILEKNNSSNADNTKEEGQQKYEDENEDENEDEEKSGGGFNFIIGG